MGVGWAAQKARGIVLGLRRHRPCGPGPGPGPVPRPPASWSATLPRLTAPPPRGPIAASTPPTTTATTDRTSWGSPGAIRTRGFPVQGRRLAHLLCHHTRPHATRAEPAAVATPRTAPNRAARPSLRAVCCRFRCVILLIGVSSGRSRPVLLRALGPSFLRRCGRNPERRAHRANSFYAAGRRGARCARCGWDRERRRAEKGESG